MKRGQRNNDQTSTVLYLCLANKRTVVAAPQMHACQPRTIFNCRDVASVSVPRSRGVPTRLCLALRRLVNIGLPAAGGCMLILTARWLWPSWWAQQLGQKFSLGGPQCISSTNKWRVFIVLCYRQRQHGCQLDVIGKVELKSKVLYFC